MKDKIAKPDSSLKETEMLKLIQKLEEEKKELERQNNELQIEKLRLSAILEGTNVGIWEQNIPTKEVFYDDRYLEMIGYTLDEISPVTLGSWKKYAHPDDVKKSEELLKKHAKGELNYYECEFRMKHKNGNWIWILDKGRINKRDNDGVPLHISGTHQDITQRKEAEQTLATTQKLLKDIIDNSQALIYVFDTEGKLLLINKNFETLFGIQLNSTVEITRKSIMPSEIAEEHHINDLKVINTGLAITVEEKNSEQDGIHTYLSVKFPLQNLNGQIYAVGGISVDITEQKRTEIALKESENRYRLLIESANEAILVAQGDNLKFVNAKMVELTGYTENELLTIPFIELIHPDDREKMISNYKKRLIGEGVGDRYELKIVTKNKTIKWVEFGGIKIDWKGNPASMNFIIDITQRKTTEEALKESEERYRSLVEFSPDGIAVHKDGKLLYINQAAIVMLGANSNKNFIGKSIIEFIHHDSRQITLMNLKIISKAGIVLPKIEEKFIKLDGTTIDVEVHSVSINYNGELAILSSIHNITERNNTEKALKESEEKFRTLVQQATDAIFVADMEGKYHDANESAERLTGYSVNELIKMNAAEIVEANDLKNTPLKLKELKTGKPTVTERIICKKDGTLLNAEVSSKLMDNGKVITIIRDITERKQAEADLKDSEERYRSLVEWTTEAIVVHRNGKIIYANPAAHSGIKAKANQKLVGKSVIDLIHPDYQNLMYERAKMLVNIGDFTPIVEAKYIGMDGSIIDVETQAILINYNGIPAIQASLHDITNRKKSEIAFKESEEQYRSLIEWTTEAIIVHRNGKIIYANPAAYSGIKASGNHKLLGKSIIDFIHPDYKNVITERIKKLVNIGDFSPIIEVKFIGKDGSIIDVETQARLINYNGIPSIQASIRDITNHKNIKKEILKAKEKAEESDRLKSAFLANMSHEIRTPMNGILGFTNLLKDKTLTSENQQEYIKIIDQSGERLLVIINDIIDISKIESNQMMLTFSDGNVNKKMKYIYNFFKPETLNKGIYLNYTNGLPENEANFNTDTEKVYAVLINLVKNAIKFCDEGAIEFGYTLKTNNRKTELEFYVKDSGVGIPKDRQKAVFERFIQSDISDKRAFQGAGLGLSISKAYIKMLGGKIWVESEVGIGTSFYFTIPYKPTVNMVNAPLDIVEKKELEVQIKNLKTLIVEDDAISKLLITKVVSKFSREVLEVSTGAKAVEVCRNNPDIDLIMMDRNMPEMNGYEAAEKIRKFNKKVVIIAQTANAFASDKEEAIKVGCNDYISKPINMDALNKLLQKHFE